MATKKRLLLLHFNGNEFEETKELGLPDAALALGWCGASVCLGFKRECAARFPWHPPASCLFALFLWQRGLF